MITFENDLDIRTREQSAPCVARFAVGDGTYRFIVIGTDYGHIHLTSGDVRTWKTRAAAQRYCREYVRARA
jgi:hypothetical protein